MITIYDLVICALGLFVALFGFCFLCVAFSEFVVIPVYRKFFKKHNAGCGDSK